MSLGNAMGGPEKAQAMSKGQGVSLILKSLSINFKRPVTYPDRVSAPTVQRLHSLRLSYFSWLSFSSRTSRTSPGRYLSRGSISSAERRFTRTRNKLSWQNLIVSWCGTITRSSRNATLDLRRGAWL